MPVLEAISAGAVAVAVLILTGAIEFWHLAVITPVSGAAFSFNMPGRQALVAILVLVGVVFVASAWPRITAPFGDSDEGINGAVWGFDSRALRELGVSGRTATLGIALGQGRHGGWVALAASGNRTGSRQSIAGFQVGRRVIGPPTREHLKVLGLTNAKRT